MEEPSVPEYELLVEVNPDAVDSVETGKVIRRIGGGKDQQGLFTRFDDDGGMVLVSIIDPAKCEFVADAGILRPAKGDSLYVYRDRFARDRVSDEAFAIIREWTLYNKHPELQSPINYFVVAAYSPSQILLYKKKDMLNRLFVPIQQKFKIGRFEEKIDWNKVRKDRFREQLETMHAGEHITYLGLVPQGSGYSPAFYSVGTKPHYETHVCLQSEPYNFVPTHGGHVRAVKGKSGKRAFVVDAGSEYKGKGVKTLLSTAEDVVRAMKKMYPDFEYHPVEGRGAFGTDQSY